MSAGADGVLRANARRSVVIAALALVLGCDGGTPAPTASPEELARTTLDRALGYWRSGETPEGVKKVNPSIVVSDPRWTEGRKLTKYEVLGGGEPSGAERVFQVKIWHVDSGGKESQETVAYRVGTQPIFTVFRALF